MARGTKKREASGSGEADPEAAERKRLKTLAFSNKILSETPAKSSVHLNPSNTVLKHHGKDILKKSQRKNRYLFSFPGLIAPISGGKIGELKNLGTKNPILYLDFPQGQMKLFGTIVYPKNRYLTLQFSRGGKNVMCEDSFDNVIVFSDAWWIGRKEDNPQEAKLEFPKELYEGQQAEYDFKGGAGATSVANQSVSKTRMQCAEQQSPKTPCTDDFSDSENNAKDTKEAVPVRHSERTARKAYKFAELSSGDDSAERSPDLSKPEEKVVEVNAAVNGHSNKELNFQRRIKSVLQGPSLRKCPNLLQQQHLRKSHLVNTVHLFRLLFPHYSRKWKKRRLQEIQRNIHHQKFPARSCSELVQKGILSWMKDPGKRQKRLRTKILGKISRQRVKNVRLKMIIMMTLKNFQVVQRILMEVMKIGLHESVQVVITSAMPSNSGASSSK